MLPLLISDSLLSTDSFIVGAPWEFHPDPEEHRKVIAMSALERRRWRSAPGTRWCVYSTFRGRVQTQAISADNPVSGIRGIAFDYDSTMSRPEVERLLEGLPNPNKPTWLEYTLSGRWRVVWVLSEELLVTDTAAAEAFLHTWKEDIKADRMLAGWDAASLKPQQRWTFGREWIPVGPPVERAVVVDCYLRSLKKHDRCGGGKDIELTKVAAKVQEMFPDRWRGEFILNACGVRFWDPAADAPEGCQVKRDGMMCFTGPVPFKSWADIFGAKWVGEQTNLGLAESVDGIFWDDVWFWSKSKITNEWHRCNHDVVTQRLRGAGLSSTTPKGATQSPLGAALDYIYHQKRVSGVAPLVNFPPGLVEFDNRRLLNTTDLQPIPLVPGLVTPERDFPWLWFFLNGLFDSRELGSWDHFMAWHKRSLFAFRHHELMPGQAIFLCGPVMNGKTLLARRVVAASLGGRAASPWPYWLGDTQFNSELFTAFCWLIDDEEAPKDYASRERVMSRLKGAVANPEQTYSRKFCDTLSSIPHVGRFFGTLNDDPKSTGVLPEAAESIQDKVMFFGSLPYAKTFPRTRVIADTIARELPYYVTWLERQYEPPSRVLIPGCSWDTGRMGVKSFHDPRIRLLSFTQGPAYNLHELIRTWVDRGIYWHDGKQREWAGTPTTLYSEMSVDMASATRDWTATRMSHLLLALSRQEGSGVELADSFTRTFRIVREIIEQNTYHG